MRKLICAGLLLLIFAVSLPMDPALADDCPNSLPPLLQQGQVGRVSQRFSTLRTAPASSRGAAVYSPAYFVVLQGPICVNNQYWYEIRYTNGRQGWALESSRESEWGRDLYWLEAEEDGDGIPDRWERDGVWIVPDGHPESDRQFVDLPALGADPNVRDIFVQLDWVGGTDRNYALSPEALRLVVQAFQDHGINLHIDHGPSSILNYATNETWGDRSRARQWGQITLPCTTTCDWIRIDEIKNTPCARDSSGEIIAATCGFTLTGRERIFHYAVSIPTILNKASGVARDDANRPRRESSDFVLSLGDFLPSGSYYIATGLSSYFQAGTFMHELGHNLGLRHGGGTDEQYIPNYVSVMNYLYQDGLLFGATPSRINYSSGSMPPLDERALNEAVGLLAPTSEMAQYGMKYFCGGIEAKLVADLTIGIDWNCNSVTDQTPVSVDINMGPHGVDGNGMRLLVAYNDWSNLIFTGGNIGRYGLAPSLPRFTPLNETYTPELAELLGAVTLPLTQGIDDIG